MDKKFAIFDLDGTLIDSMGFWKTLGAEYLKSKGISCDWESLSEEIAAMTMSESAELFVRRFDLPFSPEEAAEEMNRMLEEDYRNEIPLKPGVRRCLNGLCDRGVRMCVASATAESLAVPCLDRLGILSCFEFILSCETLGTHKREPKIYLEAAERFGRRPREIAVYEDAMYAMETAKGAGFYVVAVYDDETRESREAICDIADETINFNMPMNQNSEEEEFEE